MRELLCEGKLLEEEQRVVRQCVVMLHVVEQQVVLRVGELYVGEV